MCSSQPGLSQCIVWAGVGGADFPSVSLVTGRDFSLWGGGALVCTFTRWEGGVEGAALPLTKLYRHKNTAPITTTLSRALRERERRAVAGPEPRAQTFEDGSVPAIISQRPPRLLNGAENTRSRGAHLHPVAGSGPQTKERPWGPEPKAPCKSLPHPLHPPWPNVYHNTGSRARSAKVPRSTRGAKGDAAAATAPGSSRVLSKRCSLSLLEWSALPSSKA